MSESNKIKAELQFNGRKIAEVLGLISTTDIVNLLQYGKRNPVENIKLKRLLLGPMNSKDVVVGLGRYTVIVEDVEVHVSLMGKFIPNDSGYEIDAEVFDKP